MNINLSTLVITKGTCLVRGKSSSDKLTKKRYFGYFGEERDIEKFCRSKKFVSRYAKENIFEYYKIVKNVILIKLPYTSLEMYTDEELQLAVDIATQLIGYVDTLKKESETVSKYGYNETVSAIFDVLLPFSEDLPDILARLHESVYTPLTTNPDTIFSDLVCELGFKGWVRQANFDTYTSSDEILLCDIDEMRGYVSETRECNLSTCEG